MAGEENGTLACFVWWPQSGGGFIVLFPFTPGESSPPSASGVTPGAADAGHILHPERRKSTGAAALQCHGGLSPRADLGPGADLSV